MRTYYEDLCERARDYQEREGRFVRLSECAEELGVDPVELVLAIDLCKPVELVGMAASFNRVQSSLDKKLLGHD